MSDIKKYRNVIDNAVKEDPSELEQYVESLPNERVYENHNGLALVVAYLERDKLDENAITKLKSMFGDIKGSMGDLASGTKETFSRTFKKIAQHKDLSMSKQMQKQVKILTKKLKDKYYMDYGLTLNAYEKRKMRFSQPFFMDLIQSFGVSPTIELEVRKHFSSEIRKFVSSVQAVSKEYHEDNPNAPKPKNKKQAYEFLPKKRQRNILDDANFLVGSIIGFTSAVAIAEYFRNNLAKFEESSEALSVVNESYSNEEIDIISNKVGDNLYNEITEYHEDEIIGSLKEVEQDDNFWEEDLEDEHENIYQQYVKR